MGIAGFVIGLIGIFLLSFILSPLALIFGIIAIFKKETVWGIFAIIFAIIGMATSPVIKGMFFYLSLFQFIINYLSQRKCEYRVNDFYFPRKKLSNVTRNVIDNGAFCSPSFEGLYNIFRNFVLFFVLFFNFLTISLL